MTRCKKGDLAIFERNTTPFDCYNGLIGVPIVCAELAFDPTAVPVWRASRPLACPRCGSMVRYFVDADLRPIRGQAEPGETEAPADIIRELAPI